MDVLPVKRKECARCGRELSSEPTQSEILSEINRLKKMITTHHMYSLDAFSKISNKLDDIAKEPE